MDFRIADTFTGALARLPAAEQKAVKVSVLDLQLDPSAPGLQLHRIEKSRDANFWSARLGRDLPLILHRTASSILVAFVGHHDAAYAWAERRRIEAHPRTGAVQIVEVCERVEETLPALARLWEDPSALPVAEGPLFADLADEALFRIGVPADWLGPVKAASEAAFYTLADHLPAEAAEALLEYATTGVLRSPQPRPDAEAAADPFEHPDARRRFLTIKSSDELAAALDAPLERWNVFLHPSQVRGRAAVQWAGAGGWIGGNRQVGGRPPPGRATYPPGRRRPGAADHLLRAAGRQPARQARRPRGTRAVDRPGDHHRLHREPGDGAFPAGRRSQAGAGERRPGR